MRDDILESKEDILEWINENQPKAEIARKLNCRIQTLDSWLVKMGIDYKGNQSGRDYKTDPSYVPALEYLKNPLCKSYLLKYKLIRDGIKEAKCEICGLEEWLGDPIPLELDHINGNRYDHRLKNLRIICPNCHSMQPTNSGKNINSYH